MTKWFKSSEELKKVTGFDCYISGSDQIWNMWFIEFGEGKESYVYFLNFVPENKIIASYAASFGTEQCDERYTDKICSCLKRYDFISVRENTGQKLLESLNINNSRVVPDPTLLLESGYYEKLIKRKRPKEQYAFVYMLHDRIEDAKKAVDKFESKCFKIKYSSNESVENWLANIKYSSFVITNSFHGMVFAILFNVPFMVILVEASGMNDRIYTLLNKLGLESRIYDKKSNCIPTDDIDWKMVNEKLSLYRKVGCDFISEIINYEKG